MGPSELLLSRFLLRRDRALLRGNNANGARRRVMRRRDRRGTTGRRRPRVISELHNRVNDHRRHRNDRRGQRSVLRRRPCPVTCRAAKRVLPCRRPSSIRRRMNSGRHTSTPVPCRGRHRGLGRARNGNRPGVDAQLTITRRRAQRRLTRQGSNAARTRGLRRRNAHRPFFNSDRSSGLPDRRSGSRRRQRKSRYHRTSRLTRNFRLTSELLAGVCRR